ncbi:Mu transposase C-terminal domain-containing protein [Methylobacterium fujisawaense]|uniref:Mu transposase C-terminal domain-containing protein n=1 Tax=Methylobacterium fujisawaense TaxID=107400 RepID=UPI00244B4581|nr:Mu transposase C-terminal domain-containing protein [Methylobacterium fujisawaense]MDH3028649.1 Mu transposase C-terminal domain-containing protein [Methylobacterium fujisawaense]
MEDWVTASEVAQAAGISERKVRHALGRIGSGKAQTWRGSRLNVRMCHGRGGQAGASWRVLATSLPPELQLRIEAAETRVEGLLNPSARAVQAAEWWAYFLRPALAHPKGSRERRSVMEALAGVEVCGPDGRWFVPSLRDIERKVSKATASGIRGLVRKRREVKPESLPIITRRWDAATVALDDDTRERIAGTIQRYIRALWGNGTSYSGVVRLASERLAELTAQAGIGDYEANLSACRLPKHVIEAGRDARRVHGYRTNTKEWDNARPRVRLTSAGLAPMEVVYGDVHHFDVYVRRQDGSLATPKGIAWLDAANRRLRLDLVLCEPGTAVRNADLIRSFVAMTQDPHWGMPAHLYLDNGSEYAFADFVRDAIKLTNLDCRSGQGGGITRAAPYNAAAKGILEGSFRVLEQKILAPVKGYIGGDRMKTRSGNLGRAPEPFDGSFDEFCARFEGLLAYYNSDPQKGDLRGLSPAVAYGRAVKEGWQRTDADADALLMAFSTEGTRIVTDGKIRFDGDVYFCDQLAGLSGQRVRVHLPKFVTWDAVPVLTMQGALIGIARPDPVYARLDPRGAREAARRKGLALADIAATASEIDDLDVPAEMIASAARQPAPPVPESKGTIGLASTMAEMGRKVLENPVNRKKRERAEKEAKIHAALARTQMLRGTP